MSPRRNGPGQSSTIDLPSGQCDRPPMLSTAAVLREQASPSPPVGRDGREALVRVVPHVRSTAPDGRDGLAAFGNDALVLGIACDSQTKARPNSTDCPVTEVLTQEIRVAVRGELAEVVSQRSARFADGAILARNPRNIADPPIPHSAAWNATSSNLVVAQSLVHQGHGMSDLLRGVSDTAHSTNTCSQTVTAASSL